MKLLFGTANPAKLRHMQDMLEGFGLEIIGLDDVDAGAAGTVDETGNNPLENARLKAEAYYRATGLPVFSCDSGLILEGVEEREQPGVHVRRVGGQVLSDEEMIQYYTGLAAKYGGGLKAKYQNAIVLILDELTIFAHDGEDIASESFILTSQTHPARNPGFPLDSISLETATGRYFSAISPDPSSGDDKLTLGFRSFFERALISLQHMEAAGFPACRSSSL
jgi:XTP/dITP diphosphohydrolase